MAGQSFAPLAAVTGTHIVEVEVRPGDPAAETRFDDRAVAEQYARSMADRAFRVVLDGEVVPDSNGDVNVLVYVPVKVSLGDWQAAYSIDVAEATGDIPNHVRATVLHAARENLGALGAGARVTAPAV